VNDPRSDVPVTDTRRADGRIDVWRIVAPLVLLAVLLGAWEAWVRWADKPAWFLPAPSRVGRVLWSERALLLENGWVTLQEVLVGLAVAIVAGVLIAVLIHASAVIERAVYPLVIASQAIPVIALAPLLLIWFGHGLMPKVVMTALIAFFPLAVSTTDGLKSADRETLAMFRAMGASRLQRFQFVQAPSAAPAFFSGLKVAVAVAVIGAVIGEFVGSNEGLGHTIILANASLRTDLVFACVAVLSVMAIGLFILVTILERIVLPWRRFQVEGR
jgi:ABC-type nitrate/sulfonate/bicarbonate transport system permease component